MKAERLCPWRQADVTVAVQRLKELARQILPKIENYLRRALALAKGMDRSPAGRDEMSWPWTGL
jgi:hypothetical protein